MKVQITFRPNVILALLLTAFGSEAFCLLTFTRLDSIVHSDLYRYGLQFDPQWATPYWTHARLFIAALIIALTSLIPAILLLSRQIRKQASHIPSSHYALTFIGIAAATFAAIALFLLDSIVTYDLYQYGLQFNSEWAIPYQAHTSLFFGLTAIAITCSTAAFLFASLGRGKPVEVHGAQLASITLILVGVVVLTRSVLYPSQILAFIGLGLTFWGVLLLYIRNEDYTKQILVEPATTPPLAALNQLLRELDFHGRAIYLPPKYLADPEAFKAYIPRHPKEPLPSPEQIQAQDTILPSTPHQGILITPPGAELATLFETSLGIHFTQVDLSYLQRNLPQLLIENLELAQTVEIEAKTPHVYVKIHSLTLTYPRDPEAPHRTLEPPLPSAIACALAKATGNPVLTESQQTSNDGTNLEITYTLLAEEPRET